MNKKYSLFKTSACIFLLAGLSVGYAATCYITTEKSCATAGEGCWTQVDGVLMRGHISKVKGMTKKCSLGGPGKSECATNQYNVLCKYTCSGTNLSGVVFSVEASVSRSADALQGQDCYLP